MKYIIEPMQLAVSAKASREEFEDFVDHLLEWKDWLVNHSHEIYMLSDTDDYLYNTGNYPDVSVIKELVRKYHIQYVDINDVNKTIRQLIDFSIKIDYADDFSNYEWSEYTFRDTPESFDGREEPFKEAMIQILWYVFLLTKDDANDKRSFTAFLSGISRLLNIQFEYIRDSDGDLITEDGNLELRCMSSLKDFWDDMSTPYVLWKQATNKDDIALGARISAYQFEGLSFIDEAYQKYDFNIQSSFYDDYVASYQTQDGYTRSILTSITQALAESRKNTYHPYREGKESTKKQKERLGYKAERRDCTRGVHTHYWKKGFRLLFANLGEHEDMEMTNPCED